MAESLFLRLLPYDDKAAALAEAVVAAREGRTLNPVVHTVDPTSFHQVPGSPFAYWVSPFVLRLFVTSAGERHGVIARLGMQTNDDFRFLRLWVEVPSSHCEAEWRVYAKGGDFSPYYLDHHLTVFW